MEEAKTTLVKTLEQDVQSSLKRLGYLLDVYNFTAVDMELNQTTLTWPKRLDPIFEQNEQVIPISCVGDSNTLVIYGLRQIVEESKHKGEAALTDKQEKALIEIEKCHGYD